MFTKKLDKLLIKYHKANRKRRNAYAKRSREYCKTYAVPYGIRSSFTPQLKAELDANIEKARLRKLEVSKELRDYCKKNKWHIRWGSNNQVLQVISHLTWQARFNSRTNTAINSFMMSIFKLKLCKERHVL